MNQHEPTTTLDGDSTRVVKCTRAGLRGPRSVGNADRHEDGLLEQLLVRPELTNNRSFLIESAVDEFEKLATANPSLMPEDYCRRFAGLGSSLQSSICRQLEVECFVRDNSWLDEKLRNEPWPRPGERRGSFTIIEEIGRGALSRVYLCSQPELGNRQVVVKMATSSRCEADALGRLRHHNVVPIYSVEMDSQSGLTMLCMPFLGRSTLYDLLDVLREDSSPPVQQLFCAARTWEQPSDRVDEYVAAPAFPRLAAIHHIIAWIGQQLAGALAHAHAHGVFHGDVKPSNILLTRDGVPLLMDFNLSGNIALSVAANGGTLPYMPPEQLRAVALANESAAQYDQRSDIYSLGVVLYEALTGQVPFTIDVQGGGQAEIATRLLELQQHGPTPIRSLRNEVPAKLADLVERCLRFHPNGRFQHADQLAALLKAETGPWKRLGWRVLVHRRKAQLVASILAIICMAGVMALSQRLPRHVRLLHEAIRYRSSGDHILAEESLVEALKLRPSYADALFEMARTAIATKSLLAANEALGKLEELQPSARSAAYLAYCFNLQGEHRAAIPWYLQAIKRGGDTPEVLNNLCYSYEKGGSTLSPKEERAASHSYLTSALEQAPNSPSVRLNWIRLAIERFGEDGVPIPDNMPQVCRELAIACPDSGYVYDRAATVFALLASSRPELREEGFGFLNRAIDFGFGPDAHSLVEFAQWAPYRDHPGLATLIDQLARGKPPISGSRVPLILEPVSLAGSLAAAE